MKILEDLESVEQFRQTLDAQKYTLGLVPTMGALHQGHASLAKRSLEENDRTLVSIFLNPTQFNDPKDLDKYPSTLDRDLALLAQIGVAAVFIPSYEQLYPDAFRFKVIEQDYSKQLCGLDRPGHFDGVLTVVLKLLNLTGADIAYFGEKDFQQYKLVHDMAKAFFLKTQIICCPTIREADGLAMSSRNQLLSSTARLSASQLYREITQKGCLQQIKQRLEAAGFEIDYLLEQQGRRFAAVRLEGVRLIDNVEI